MNAVTDLTELHWLVMDADMNIVGCHCGFRADESDCGYGDGTVKHFLEMAWDQGHAEGLRYSAVQNPYAEKT